MSEENKAPEEMEGGLNILSLKVEECDKGIKEANRPKLLEDSAIFALPRYSWNGYLGRLNGMTAKDVFRVPDNNPKAMMYQDAVLNSSKITSKNDWDQEQLMKESAQWDRVLTSDDQRIGMQRYNVKHSNDVGGEPLALSIQERLGLGSPRSFPLYGSGFYVRLIPSKGPDLSALMINILEKARDVGGRTGGVAYDIGSTFVEQEILDHIFSNIRGSTLKDVPVNEIRNHIVTTDYRRLIVGQLIANHPNGVMYDQPCIANMNKCQHVHTGKIDLNTIARVDVNLFTEKQRRHMAKSRKEVTLVEVEAYRESFHFDNVRKRVYGKDGDTNEINVVYHVPRIVDLHESYTNAINHLSSVLPTSLIAEEDADARGRWLRQQLASLPIFNHIAWIKEIHVGQEDEDDYIVCKDPDAIRDVMVSICDGDLHDEEYDEEGNAITIVDRFIKSFNEVMVMVNTDIVVMRNQPCPKCGEVVNDFEGKALEYIPLEAESLFLAIAQFQLQLTGRLNRYVI